MQLIHTDSDDAGRRKAAVGGRARQVEARIRRRFTFDFSRPPEATLITLAGELDVVCADAFKRRFGEATSDDPNRVVIDVRELTFIDSTGLALLLGVNEMSRVAGFTLWIVANQQDPPSKIFRMTGMDKVLPLVDEPPDFGPAA